MKIKNLFKSLVVIALVVPFVVALTACGGGDKSIDPAKAYDELVTAFSTQSTTKKLTYTLTSKADGHTNKTVFGYDMSGTTPANDFFAWEYEDDVVTHKHFTAGTGADKKVYEYIAEEDGWQAATPFDDSQYANYLSEYQRGVGEMMQMISIYFPQDNETTFEEYKDYLKTMAAEFNDQDAPEAVISFEGKQYKDKSVGLKVKMVLTIEGETETDTVEIVAKNGVISRISLVGKQSYEYTVVEDYLASKYVPTDLTTCVPATQA